MQPEGSLQCSQKRATVRSPEPYESNPHPPTYFFKIHSDIIFPSTPRFSGWSLPFRFSDQHFVYISHFFHVSYNDAPISSSLALCTCNKASTVLGTHIYIHPVGSLPRPANRTGTRLVNPPSL